MKSTNPINYFEYVDPSYIAESDEKLKEVAEGLYEQISEFYMFLIEAIEPEDYARMQEHLGFTETYDEHIESLTDGVPPRETSLEQITSFLGTYKEFVDEEYIDVLKQLNSRIQMNREVCKQQAYQILQQQSESLNQREGQLNNSVQNMTQGTVQAMIGGKIMSFNTHNNPLLVSLYSLLLVWFSLKHYGEPPRPVVYTETDEEAERLNAENAGDNEDEE